MIFRQLFDYKTYTYTYLIADEQSRQALLIDPVKDQVASYLQLLKELELKLAFAIDTHVHADHITALGELRDTSHCKTLGGKEAPVDCLSETFSDGGTISVGTLQLTARHTPGHTSDSYSFYLEDGGKKYLFTGDTLLIRGTGRTDFQNGDPNALYNSLFNKLLKYPDDTLVYPGHDYKGWSQSTIKEEKQFNPRLLVKSKDEFVTLMNNLKLPDPAFMDVAIPANLQCGKSTEKTKSPNDQAQINAESTK